jgi:hypothetical protein
MYRPPIDTAKYQRAAAQLGRSRFDLATLVDAILEHACQDMAASEGRDVPLSVTFQSPESPLVASCVESQPNVAVDFMPFGPTAAPQARLGGAVFAQKDLHRADSSGFVMAKFVSFGAAVQAWDAPQLAPPPGYANVGGVAVSIVGHTGATKLQLAEPVRLLFSSPSGEGALDDARCAWYFAAGTYSDRRWIGSGCVRDLSAEPDSGSMVACNCTHLTSFGVRPALLVATSVSSGSPSASGAKNGGLLWIIYLLAGLALALYIATAIVFARAQVGQASDSVLEWSSVSHLFMSEPRMT